MRLQQVATGPARNGETVITAGVKEGDRVVTDGQLRLRDGAKVEIVATPGQTENQRP